MPQVNKNLNKLDPAVQRRIAQLVDQYKRQLETVIPMFKGLLETRNELLAIVEKNIGMLTSVQQDELASLLQATKETIDNAGH